MDVLIPLAAASLVGAVGLVAVFGRDRDDDEYTVADYRPEPKVRLVADVAPYVAAVRRSWPLVNQQTGSRLVRSSDVAETPEAGVPWRPPYAELVVAQVVRRYGTSPADIAARMLREIAAEQRAKIADRDLTGAFPVVAVAR